MRCRPVGLACLCLLLSSSFAQAQFLNLDPGATLQLFTTNSIDGYDEGRGVVIQVNNLVTVTGVGLFTQPEVNGFSPTWRVWLTTSYPGGVNNTLLQTQTPGLQSDVGLTYYDTALTPLLLVPGNRYHFEVTYLEPAQQNWFYDVDLVDVNLGDVNVQDGTMSGGTGNTVMPGMRLQFAAVPEPATMTLIGNSGLVIGGGYWYRRRRANRR